MAVNVNWTGGQTGRTEGDRQAASRRRHSAEKKQERAQARAEQETKQRLRRETLKPGTKEYERAMKKLKKDVTYLNAEFVLYPERMDKWSAQMAEIQRIDDDRLNKDYLHSMYNLTLKPLDDGLSATGVAECLGAYIGMAVVSPTFRRDANKNIIRAMTPVVEQAAKMNCKVSDWTDRGLNAIMTGAEKITGKELPGHQAREDYVGHDWRESASVRAIHEMYIRADNNGRLPYTPESAAMQYLRHTTSAYEAMRQPGADIDKIKEQFTLANERLYTVAEMDGISRKQLNKNVRTMAGELIEQYPDFRGVFAETAYFNTVRNLENVDQVEMPGGQTVGVWRGQFRNAVTHEPFEGAFTPRPPFGAVDTRDFIRDFCDRTMSTTARNGGFRLVTDMVSSPEWTQQMEYFANMVEDDIPAFCKTAEEADAQIQGDMSRKMVSDIATEFGAEFGTRYGFTADDEADFRAYEQSQRQGRDVSDMPTVDGEMDYGGGPDYV